MFNLPDGSTAEFARAVEEEAFCPVCREYVTFCACKENDNDDSYV